MPSEPDRRRGRLASSPASSSRARPARGLVLSLALAPLWACEGETSIAIGRPADLPDRVIREVEWETVFELKGSLQDTTMYRAKHIAADAQGLSVLDPGRSGLLRFSRDGRLLWTFGRRGEGPDEFLRAIGVQIDAAGRTWVADDRNMRVTVLDRDGRVSFRIPLNDLSAPPNGLAPLSGDRVLLATLDPTSPLVLVGRDGRPLERLAFPEAELARLDPIAAQFTLAADPERDRAVAAFTMLDAFFALAGAEWLPYRGWYAEGASVPQTETRERRIAETTTRQTRLVGSVTTALSVDLAGDRLYVLFGGSTEDHGRLLDIHSAATGEYLESLRLPRRGHEIAVAQGVLYLTYASPYPSIVGFRLPSH